MDVQVGQVGQRAASAVFELEAAESVGACPREGPQKVAAATPHSRAASKLANLRTMELTEEKFHLIALDARTGLRECLQMIELHDRDSQRAFLNPSIVLTAVATWERFIVDTCSASETSDWRIEDTGWERAYDSTVPWPGGSADRDSLTRHPRSHDHHVDEVLIRNGAMTSPLTSSWVLHVATSWWGADPTEWCWAEYTASPAADNRDVIRAAMLGAKSARDAAGHRLYYKKARQAQGYRTNLPDSEVDQRDWCYVWQSDNPDKSRRAERTPENPSPGRPTIQHGYARGVVALFIQLVDITIASIREHQGWITKNSQLPSEWFGKTISSGLCAGMTLWNGHELWR